MFALVVMSGNSKKFSYEFRSIFGLDLALLTSLLCGRTSSLLICYLQEDLRNLLYLPEFNYVLVALHRLDSNMLRLVIGVQ